MKKGLIFVLFALVSIVSYSQISWNAKVGMNMSNFTGDSDTDMRVGFNVGVGMEYQFTFPRRNSSSFLCGPVALDGTGFSTITAVNPSKSSS